SKQRRGHRPTLYRALLRAAALPCSRRARMAVGAGGGPRGATPAALGRRRACRPPRASTAESPWRPRRRPTPAAVAAASAVEEGSGPSSSPPEEGSGAPAKEEAELEAEKGPPPAALSRPPARSGCPRRLPLRSPLLA